MATAWDTSLVGWTVVVMGWLLTPVMNLLVPKILSCLGFDADKKVKDLEYTIIPELQQTLRKVDQARMMQRGDEKRMKGDVAMLDKMAAMLRHAQEDAEDIFDDAQDKIVVVDMLYGRCLGIACIVQKGSAWLLHKSFLCRFLPKSVDLDTLMAKVSSDLDPLMFNPSSQQSPLDRVRMLSKTSRADMLKTILELRRRPRLEYTNQQYIFLSKLDSCVWRAEEEAEDIHDAQAEDTAEESKFLDKMVVLLRQAEDAHQEIGWGGNSWPHRLYGAVKAYVARCNIARTIGSSSPAWFQRRSENELPVTRTAASEKPILVDTSAPASDEADPITSSAAASSNTAAPSNSSGRWLSCVFSSFDFFKNCCGSILYWLVHVFKAVHFYRDRSYEVVGINKSYEENASSLDFVLTAISRCNLKKRIDKIESTVSEVRESKLLDVSREATLNEVANKNRSTIKSASNRKVFGRKALRDSVMAMLRETPHSDASSSSTSPCYSVIGIYGVAGSGKTTFARYIRDHIEEKCKGEKLFDIIMCIHVSETFSVNDIFRQMLKDVTNNPYSSPVREELKEMVKDELRGKRFFLILDDLWVKNKNDPQLEELISPLNVGMKGSKILVTARTKVAARALCADEPIQMPDLDEDLYVKMFMHYALGGTSVGKEFIRVGREIAERLRRSPIAAVTVAGRLGTNLDIDFWKNTAKLDMLNDTMDALWWSYQFLNPDIRRCFEYCNIFPRRTNLRRDELVRMWIAQGFVKTSSATEDMEHVAESYVQELASCLFLQPEGKQGGTDRFTIHDLLHDLLDKVAGNDCFRIDNERSERGEGWIGDVPRDVRHLFVVNYDRELITEKILGLENLRTLIIYNVEEDTPVEEKVIESICMRLLKLRVLAIAFNQECDPIGNPTNEFLVPECIIQLKLLRYLAIRISYACTVILPSALAKLHHIQLLDFGNGQISEFTFLDLTNLRHIFCQCVNFPNVGKLSSLQTIPCFTVRNEQGYKVKQLRGLNKLCGKLEICGLNSVSSKDEALEANLAAKEWLTELTLRWDGGDRTRCSPEVEAEVLEGLCPPVGLQTLDIGDYQGSRYPYWMVGKQNGGPKNLQQLKFSEWKHLGPGPELEAFPHLHVLRLFGCNWDTLPGNMEHLTSLKELVICKCMNIRSLPTLPPSLEEFRLKRCNREFMKSCQTVRHPNWEKIEHIPKKTFEPSYPIRGGRRRRSGGLASS